LEVALRLRTPFASASTSLPRLSMGEVWQIAE
jgi:hypothetical protein